MQPRGRHELFERRQDASTQQIRDGRLPDLLGFTNAPTAADGVTRIAF
jgi:hypothetical protein